MTGQHETAHETGWAMPWPGADIARVAEQVGCQAFCCRRVRRPQRVRRIGRDGRVHDDRQGRHRRRLRVRPVTVRACLGGSPRRQDRSGPRVPRARFRHPPDERVRGSPHRPTGRSDAWPTWSARSAPTSTAPNMKPVRHDGEFYPIDAAIMAPVLGPIDVPIVLGAFNEGMLQRRRPRRRRHHRPRPVHRSLVERDDRPQPRRRCRPRRPRPRHACGNGAGSSPPSTTTTRAAPNATPG